MFQEQMILRIPGPTPVPSQVERAMSRPMIGHRSGDFSQLFAETAERLKYVFQTQNSVYIMAGSGTSGLEAAVANTVNAGDTVLVLTGGNFGERFVKIVKAYGANVVTVSCEWGQAIDPREVEAALIAHPEIKVVFATHCETSTGVLHDIRALGEVVKKTDALLVVDAVSSLGGADIPMDAWNIDVLVTGSQKCLMLPTGLCFISLSPKAWEVVEGVESPRFYFDLRAYRKQFAANTTPYTPAVSLVFGLAEVMTMFEKEGLQNVFDRHLLMQKMTREAMRALGLTLFTADEVSSPTVTSVKGSGYDVEAMRKILRKDFNMVVAGGQQHLKGEIFRVGHMGFATPIDMLQAITALEIALLKAGAPIQLGAGVRAAQETYLQKQEVTANV
ncbi:MAG: alanine--glyoxylate aminotransferase family protein [Tumebacillaceae bacterium]